MNTNNSYPSNEKLKSRKALELLFASGKSFSVFPIKVFFTLTPVDVATPKDTLLNAGVGVSARNFKKAVDRNRIKRLLREVYRTQKQELHKTVQAKNNQLSVFFLFIGKELPVHEALNNAMAKVLEKLNERILG